MIIGICGPAGSGKTTVADYVIENYGGIKLAFAHDLKALVREAFQLDKSQVYGTQIEKETIDQRYNLSGRDLMTRVGEAAKKVWGDRFWTDLTVEQSSKGNGLGLDIIIEDVRFPVEATAILAEGGMVWQLNSPWAQSKADKTHASESSWQLCEYSYRIQPLEHGLNVLFAEVDRVAQLCGMEKLIP